MKRINTIEVLLAGNPVGELVASPHQRAFDEKYQHLE